MTIIGIQKDNNQPVKIDLPRLIETRLLVQANSGGGKSWLLRRLLEQTHGKVQQIVLDLEGEFATLREKYDYVLAGKDGDIPVNIKVAPILARRLMELNTSAIIDLYELKHHERILFVKRFLDALINLPKNLWHPCLVVIDETHIFCPQTGKAESMGSVIDLCTRGRKRGLSAVLATQRISKLHKDAAAETLNRLIGRTGQDIDRKRAADELGFNSKSDVLRLRDLDPGRFFAFGPAITKSVTEIVVGDVQTTHPKVGSRALDAPPPATAKVKKALQGLIDLGKEADEELRTTDDLKRKIRELKLELRKKPKPKIDHDAVNKLVDREAKKAYQEGVNSAAKDVSQIRAVNRKLLNVLEKVRAAVSVKVETPKESLKSAPLHEFKPKWKPLFQEKKSAKTESIINNDGEVDARPLRAGAMKMLKAAAMFHPKPISKQQLATVSGFSVKGGTFNTYLSELKRNSWVADEAGRLVATDDGVRNAGDVAEIPTDPQDIVDLWAAKFRQGAARMLRAIAEKYPDTIGKEDLGDLTGFTVSGGTFNTYLSELRRNGLISVEGNEVRATKELFMED